MHNDHVLSMLGIAAKSGNVVSGEFSTEKAVKTGTAYLVITAAEASDNTKKKFKNILIITSSFGIFRRLSTSCYRYSYNIFI